MPPVAFDGVKPSTASIALIVRSYKFEFARHFVLSLKGS